MKRIAGLTVAFVLALSTAAAADPDFGTGNSVKGPNDAPDKCQTANHGTGAGANEPEPGCKGKDL